jgi:polyhydroxybutyrate depolymerase
MPQKNVIPLAIGMMAFSLSSTAGELERRSWMVEGVTREALVYAPPQARTQATPLVLVFHGHGGNMRGITRTLPIHTLWPEAIVVYPQGLPTPGRSFDREGKQPGWQYAAGDGDNRDLKFVDAMLDTLRQEYRVDERRIFATGHSNGGVFTYLLWEEKARLFAAVAPCAAGNRNAYQLTPKPVLHVAGERDNIVKFAAQQRMIEALRSINQCADESKPWGTNAVVYASRVDAPVVALIHPGGHEVPPEAAPAIVRFFKERCASQTK